jgi:hypothetical protein
LAARLGWTWKPRRHIDRREASDEQSKPSQHTHNNLSRIDRKRQSLPGTQLSTLEHILPENPTDAWVDDFPRERWEAFIDRIGNLTLLEVSANRKVGNSSYAEKRHAYSQSLYALTRRIPEIAPERWTPDLLDARQRHMAQRAVHLWRSDFPG